MCYTDGTGADGEAASAAYSEDHKGRPSHLRGTFLGQLATVAGVERTAMVLGLGDTADMLYLLTDPQTALHTLINLSRGARYRERDEGGAEKKERS